MAASTVAARSYVMDSFRDQTSRLRRTFRYPADEETESLDSEPEAMDEQEQEQLINRLAAENSSGNAFFARLLLALPLVATLPYLRALFSPSTTVFALLSITSLCSTAFLLYRLPPVETGIAPIDSVVSRTANSTSSSSSFAAAAARQQQVESPLDRFLPYLNLALVGILVLMGLVTKSDSASFGWIGMGNLPAVVYGAVIVSKMVMASVDPEKELSALKYEYKGA